VPPLVEVVAGAVVVPVLAPVVVVVPAAPLLLVVLRPDEPPPAGVVAPLSEPELEFAPLPALEFEPPEVELAVVFVDEPADPLVVETVCVMGVAALVVGTVSAGAPVVSSLPTPLPPQAASATATAIAAPPAMMARGKRLRTGSCICLGGNPA
jgi:hypothetical protein